MQQTRNIFTVLRTLLPEIFFSACALWPAWVALLFIGCNKDPSEVRWHLLLHQPGKKATQVVTLPANLEKDFVFRGVVEGVDVVFQLKSRGQYRVFKAVATAPDSNRKIFFSLEGRYRHGEPFNFDGEVRSAEVYRQSPHDINAWIVTTIARQAVPMVAIKTEKQFHVAVSNSPFFYDNFSSQGFYPEEKRVSLRSGDDGTTPGLKPDTAATLKLDYNAEKTQIFSPGKVMAYYHTLSAPRRHVFEGILFTMEGESVHTLRRHVNRNAGTHFSNGKFDDYFGALAFTTAHMNLRKNETGKSTAWVVPSVEYANTQYGRDAFWLSMMLPPEYAAECLRNELAAVNHFAEYPLFAILWAYRAHKSNIYINKDQVQAYVDAVETRVRDGEYFSYLDSDGRLDFQYWGDLMAFEKDDVVTYNQGLLAVALRAAEMMGLTVKTKPGLAAERYRQLFNRELGIFPTSKKKNNIMAPDPLVGDLLSILYFDEALVPDVLVRLHFDRLVENAKTPYGFKIVSTPDGQYLRSEQYDIPSYVSQVNREKLPDGRYFRGGSYFLYDNLFLIDAHLHGIQEAEALLKWRVSVDFTIGNTTYETINTKNGEPWKPNMGWNVAIYAIWKELVDKGKADKSLFEKIDSLAENQR